MNLFWQGFFKQANIMMKGMRSAKSGLRPRSGVADIRSFKPQPLPSAKPMTSPIHNNSPIINNIPVEGSIHRSSRTVV